MQEQACTVRLEERVEPQRDNVSLRETLSSQLFPS